MLGGGYGAYSCEEEGLSKGKLRMRKRWGSMVTRAPRCKSVAACERAWITIFSICSGRTLLAPELHDAGALDAGEIEQRAVIQIMGKDDGLVGPGPGDDFRIERIGRPNRTPVCDLMPRPS